MTVDQIETVGSDADLQQVLDMMKRAQVRRVSVVDGEGRIVGVIAQADIAVKEAREQLEQVAETVEKISEPGAQR
jgi:CBS domain-containing protein